MRHFGGIRHRVRSQYRKALNVIRSQHSHLDAGQFGHSHLRRSESYDQIQQLMSERILLLDGSMGVLIHTLKLTEEQVRGKQFKSHDKDLAKATDVLVLTQPEMIEKLHGNYLDAGSDIIETNTFNGTSLSLKDLHLDAYAYDINKSGAEVARRAVDKYNKKGDKRRFVAGSMGPTTKFLSISQDANNPLAREYSFDDFVESYAEQVRGLLDGGVDILLPETSFDSLVLRACLVAIHRVFEERGVIYPVMISGTVFDGGRTINGQSIDAFWTTVSHFPMLSVGLNCSLGGEKMRPFIQGLAEIATVPISCYPNAGLPNTLGEFDETPDITAGLLRDFANEGWVNIVGGCCGTTPAHIRAIGEATATIKPRTSPAPNHYSTYAGLESLTIRPETTS